MVENLLNIQRPGIQCRLIFFDITNLRSKGWGVTQKNDQYHLFYTVLFFLKSSLRAIKTSPIINKIDEENI